MKALAVIALSVLASSFAITRAYAEEPLSASKDATFRRGHDAYFHGRYPEAIDAYEQVVALGVVSEDLYYNLGNAYLKAGQVGPAIYNYERALELDPSFDDAQFNLKVAHDVARKKGEDKLVGAEGTPMWIRAVQPFTVGGLSWLFLSVYFAFFGLLIARRFLAPGFVRVGLTALTVFAALAVIGGGALLGGRLYLADRVERAIILPDTVQVKEGPDPNYNAVFNVHAGLRVRITEKEQDWVRVRLSNGLEGWVLERDLGRL
jgi:tetratricopeptide (TPR) repeat protein